MSKVILTDIDETVLQYAAPFRAWCLGLGLATKGDLKECYSVEEFLGCSKDEANALMVRFAGEGNLDHQPPEPDAAVVLPRLYEAGYRFVGITACGVDLGVQRDRKTTLERVFGFPWEALHMVDLGASKDLVLNAFEPAIWVEDNTYHATRGAALGHRSYLLDRPYNRLSSPTGVTRVGSWEDIAAALIGRA